MAKTKHGLEQTKSDFTLVGKLTGVKKDDLLKEIKTKNGKAMRILNFGIEYEKGKTVYCSLNGFEQDKVYFYKQGDEDKGIKGETKGIAWENRMSFEEDGFNLIGVTIGLEKLEDGKTDSYNLTDFDACLELSRKLKELGDGTLLRVKGSMKQSSYEKNNETINVLKFIPNKIYLTSSEFDENEAELKNHFFHQTLVVNNVSLDKEKIEEKTFAIEGQVVGYNSINNLTLYTTRENLAKNLKNALKKNKDNLALQLYGEIKVSKSEEEVTETDDGWGDEDVSKVTVATTTRELYATGTDTNTIDVEQYTQEKIDDAISLLNKDKKVEQQFEGTSNEILETADEDDAGWEEWD